MNALFRPLLVSLLLLAAVPGLSRAEEPLVLLGIDGQEHKPLEAGGKKAIVYFFVSPYCPTSNNFMPEMNAIAADFGGLASFFFVHSDADQKAEDILRHAELMQIKPPVLFDKEQKLAGKFAATITPETVVLSPEGKVLYHGRVNDLYLKATRRQREVTKNDLREALKAIEEGKSVAAEQPPAVGCKIAGLSK